ncbi:hypothetical protein D3C76_1460220 [compost metagenome]
MLRESSVPVPIQPWISRPFLPRTIPYRNPRNRLDARSGVWTTLYTPPVLPHLFHPIAIFQFVVPKLEIHTSDSEAQQLLPDLLR